MFGTSEGAFVCVCKAGGAGTCLQIDISLGSDVQVGQQYSMCLTLKDLSTPKCALLKSQTEATEVTQR
jgi:hypothetical protein